jgi:hypothetical protein
MTMISPFVPGEAFASAVELGLLGATMLVAFVQWIASFRA